MRALDENTRTRVLEKVSETLTRRSVRHYFLTLDDDSSAVIASQARQIRGTKLPT